MGRVGILSGTFDPIHNGHIAFAQAALREAGLDKVYILIEQKPRNKHHVSDYVQRKAMVEIALRGYKKIELLEVPSKQFSVAETLPQLQNRLEGAELFIIVGADVCIDCWSGIDKLQKQVKFIVGKRGDNDISMKTPVLLLKATLPLISSSEIRHDSSKAYELCPPVVGKYIETQKLYDSDLSSSV